MRRPVPPTRRGWTGPRGPGRPGAAGQRLLGPLRQLLPAPRRCPTPASALDRQPQTRHTTASHGTPRPRHLQDHRRPAARIDRVRRGGWRPHPLARRSPGHRPGRAAARPLPLRRLRGGGDRAEAARPGHHPRRHPAAGDRLRSAPTPSRSSGPTATPPASTPGRRCAGPARSCSRALARRPEREQPRAARRDRPSRGGARSAGPRSAPVPAPAPPFFSVIAGRLPGPRTGRRSAPARHLQGEHAAHPAEAAVGSTTTWRSFGRLRAARRRPLVAHRRCPLMDGASTLGRVHQFHGSC